MRSSVLRSVGRVLASVSVSLLPIAMAGQTAPTARGTTNDSPSRWDIFAGYSYLAPKGTVQINTTTPGVTAPHSYDAVNVGGIGSGSYFFNRFAGVQAEFGVHEWGGPDPKGGYIGTEGNDDGF